MTILSNFWVRKWFKLQSGEWMLFIWGFPEINMLNALEKASKKDHTTLAVVEESPKKWTAVDPENGDKYTVEMTNEIPEARDGPNVSVRDETMPVVPERKAMPKPGSLFGKQMDLF